MEMHVKHISHKFIDSLSDGVFAIALTLLGLDVLSIVHKISESEDLNTSLLGHWPTFLAYSFGFFTLFSWWYEYHVTSQYVVGTNGFIVWNHGIVLAWVALIPFGAALLAENLNTPNMNWGVFYFGICLFGQYWSILLQTLVAKIIKADRTFTWADDFILSKFPASEQRKNLLIFQAIPAVIGLITVSLSLINPWIALAGMMLYVVATANPVKSINRLIPMMLKLQKGQK
jgi:uncharacterized membrane protein